MPFAVLFPGQGSQEPDMGRDLAEANRAAMDLWKKAEAISGIALREIYWDNAEGDMAETRNLQPALTVANLALWFSLAEKLRPAATAGHSLGEYSALAAAGVLPLEAVLELVSLRGRLMSQADPSGIGGMAALVKLSLPEVEECLDEARQEDVLVIANYNTPAQYVVSGGKAAIARVQESARKRKGRAVPLPVSGAFHSPLMNEAAAELALAIDRLDRHAWRPARFPVYCNASPRPETDPGRIREHLKKQMISPVLWVDTIQAQYHDGCRSFVECGPKGVLGKMVGPILKEVPGTETEDKTPLWSVRNVGNAPELAAFAPA